ncbi:dUTP diphosphatase [Thiomicrorhabdus sp.]|uniref:dUTP diphosphatase n=1 Tax=Thiomicrorhabdus sp. TaxID=2039724 RepID=UPI002AA83CB1|nr:dUTP diphosphatase [Thiomicrorhabdus sp.]
MSNTQDLQNLNVINEMLSMQNTLNEMTNGMDWRSGVTQLGKTINWRRCIVMETAELIDSYPWKHWKAVDAEIDIENVRVELVDIWHFLLSLALEHVEVDEAADLLSDALKNHKLDDSNELTVIQQIEKHEAMMLLALKQDAVTAEYLSQLTQAFFDSCEVAQLSFEQMYQIYMAKNVLNKFRQDHGYKEGTYIKEWNGKEDNVVMFEVIEQMQSFSGDELYMSLKKTYSQLL